MTVEIRKGIDSGDSNSNIRRFSVRAVKGLDPSRSTQPTHTSGRVAPEQLSCMTDLGTIFVELGLTQYLDAFVEQGFDTWETILDITESDL